MSHTLTAPSAAPPHRTRPAFPEPFPLVFSEDEFNAARAARPLRAPWRTKPWGNVFAMPRPPVEHQPRASFGDFTIERRTPDRIHQMISDRVGYWFAAAYTAVPSEASREDLVACMFGIRGWTVRGRVAEVTGRHPLHGWLLTHPENGYAVFVDKSRDGDLGPDYIAPTGGPFGARPRVEWGPTLTHLLLAIGLSGEPSPFPRRIVPRALGAHALRSADPDQRRSVETMLALSGEDVAGFLAAADLDGLTIYTT